MNPLQPNSLPPNYFDALYQADPDPWKFETSDYEANKYAATIAALPKFRYRSALEIGGSIGVLTEKVAARTDALLSIDVSSVAQERAIKRCQRLPHVQFQIMQIPHEFPDQRFDLILMSEVGYYLSLEDLRKAQRQMLEALEPGGHLLLVHWTLYAKDYPLSGDEVHEAFFQQSLPLKHRLAQREEQYRLDLFERCSL